MQEPPDYPNCLNQFLKRKIWRSTLGEAHAAVEAGLPSANPPFDLTSFFIKPATDVKAFSGGIEPKDQMLGYYLADWNEDRLPADLPVWCAELVSFKLEYRVYIVRGEIRAICRYIAPPGMPSEAAYDPTVDTELNVSEVNEAVRILYESGECP